MPSLVQGFLCSDWSVSKYLITEVNNILKLALKMIFSQPKIEVKVVEQDWFENLVHVICALCFPYCFCIISLRLAIKKCEWKNEMDQNKIYSCWNVAKRLLCDIKIYFCLTKINFYSMKYVYIISKNIFIQSK